MGKHNIGDDGMSYSMVRAMENDEKIAKVDVVRIQRKLVRFMFHNTTHVGSLIALHVVALGAIDVFKGGGGH